MDDKIRIYTFTHKKFQPPPDQIYVPIHVGRGAWKKRAELDESDAELLAYLGDDSGENISEQNCYYSELTGMYWAWKNSDADIIGTSHYRRYLITGEGAQKHILAGEEIEKLLETFDVITTKKLQLNFSYYEGFAAHHKIHYLDVTEQVLGEKYPDYLEDYHRWVHEKHTYFANMLICRREIFDRYCDWLFDILFEVQRRVAVIEEDSYHRRIFGFISEFLQYVWIGHQKLRVKECMVGMFGEKAEVTETKQTLAAFFKKQDVEGAKRFLLEMRRKRPDLMMEASDITGELHLCMEVIAIAGMEQQVYGTNILDQMRKYEDLMQYCNVLNRITRKEILKEEAEMESAEQQNEDRSFSFTEVAKECARQVVLASLSGGLHKNIKIHQ